MGKKSKTDDEKNKPENLMPFKMKDAAGKPFKIMAPENSLDDHAEEALSGEYRHC